MADFQRFPIGETDRFDAAAFPQLTNSLEKIVVALNREPAGPKADMLLSFVKEHRMKTEFVTDHASLASVINTKAIPLQVMEDLFESSRNNPVFRRDLESYIRSFMISAHLY